MVTSATGGGALTEDLASGEKSALAANGDGCCTASSSEALITYRYLRFGIVAAVVMLATSVILEARNAPGGCLQTSISAFYYTPVRSIFVASLAVIGFSLIVIRGHSDVEDFLLNLAGMLAPVVALVPTSNPAKCFSYKDPDPYVMRSGHRELADWVLYNIHVNIQNNIPALLFAGLFALLLLVILLKTRPSKDSTKAASRRFTWSLLVTMGLVLIGALLFIHSRRFETNTHTIAATAMFACLGVVVFLTERRCQVHTYRLIYRGIWAVMALTLIVAKLPFRHNTLVVEIFEIAAFATFWIVETRERWSDV